MEASAELRETRGFISITSISPSAGFTANWMLHPPASTVQYHPEAGPGPHDARHLFDRFLAGVAAGA